MELQQKQLLSIFDQILTLSDDAREPNKTDDRTWPLKHFVKTIIKFEEDEPVLAISAKWMKGTNYSKKIHSSLFRQQTLTKTYQNSFMRFQPILLKLTRWMISRLTSKTDTSAKGQSEIMKKFVSMQGVGGQITMVAFALLTLPVWVRISPLP